MAEDVELLSDRDVDQIVMELRRNRAVWAANEAAGKVTRATGAKKASTKGMVSVDLKDLFP